MEAAKIELAKEFPKEQELKEKSARLAELTLLLKPDKADREILDDEPGTEDIVKEPHRSDAGSDNPQAGKFRPPALHRKKI